jgi:hypothetical protein
MTQGHAQSYHAYLLRFWREHGSESWRATLEDPHSGEMIGFASMQQLFAYLDEKSASQIEKDKASFTGDRKTVE